MENKNYVRLVDLEVGTPFYTKDLDFYVVTGILAYGPKGAKAWSAISPVTGEEISDYRNINVYTGDLTLEEKILAIPYTV